METGTGGVLGLEGKLALLEGHFIPRNTAEGDAHEPELGVVQFARENLARERLFI